MVTVADEAWIATALLHREQPDREAFRTEEILERARLERVVWPLRPGVGHHVTYHAVANKRPNPARHRFLYATTRGERRLFRNGDDFHPERTGKTHPAAADLPEKYRHLVDWYESAYRRFGWNAHAVREGGVGFRSGPLAPPENFKETARRQLSQRFGLALAPGTVPGVPKVFDFVSEDRSIVGDADALPSGPGCFAAVAEHVWLLQKTSAVEKILVFAQDRQVPASWLREYGGLADDVQFYFLDRSGELIALPDEPASDRSWSALSSSAFARDWDSEEDSVYDELPAR